MRSFIGIPINNEIKEKISKIQEKFNGTGADIKFVEKENLHLTVKFLGDIKEERISDIDNIKGVIDDYQNFEINIENVGTFPSIDFIKVIWVGANNKDGKLLNLLQDVNDKLEALGFREQKNDIVPHITIGRMKSGKNKQKVKNAIQDNENIYFGKQTIDEMRLYKSELNEDSPIYETIKKYKI